MDFFNDPNLFVGVLDGLEDEGFPSAPSLVDELNLSADFEPLQMDPLGPGKPQEAMPSVSTQQAVPAYSEQMSHYIGVKAQTPIGQTFSGNGSTGNGGAGMIGNQHGQYHNAAMSQVPQSNGLYCNSSSPMWGNQDQNGSVYHHLPQHPQHQQQQLHSHQLHGRQQTQQQQHHPCHQQQEQHHRMRQQLQQQHSHHQQLLNQHQHQHQQINTQSIPMQQQQQHHSYPFHQGGQTQSQQQVYRSLPRVQPQPAVTGPGFHVRAVPNKSYLDIQNASLSRTCLQTQQQQGSYQMTGGGQAFAGSGPEQSNLLYPMHSSSMVHSMPSCSASSVAARQPGQYPAYPGEPETPSLGKQSLSSTNIAPPSSTLPELPGGLCQFQSTQVMNQRQAGPPISQASEYAFQALPCSEETQENCKSSEMFGKSMSCYPIMASQLPSEQPQSCGAINTNGYPALGDSLLPSETQDGDLEDLEPSDLLPDLLPQLEATLSQQVELNSSSWANSSQGRGHEHRKPSHVEYKEEKVMQSFKHLSLL